jgi:hypothetical protein
MRVLRSAGILVFALFLLVGAQVQAFQFHFLDFEGLADLASLTNQYAAQDVTFSHAKALMAGASLNELEFPPHSGQKVIFDDGGAMRIDFGLDTYDWSAYFTHTLPLTIRAWDASNNLLGTAVSSFSENYVSSGNAPNEKLSFVAQGGFRSITIGAEEGYTGGAFTMDDMSYTTADAHGVVPEASTVILFATGLALSGLAMRKGLLGS